MDDKEFLEELRKEVLRLKDEGTLIIVEGKRDVTALKEIGLSNVKELSGAIYEVVESVGGKEVVILTDLDKEGKRLYSMLRKEFVKRGVRVDDALREILFKSKLRQVEGLSGYLKRAGFWN